LDLVNESIEIVKYFSDEKQIKINIEVDKQVVVYVDKHMINTILRNLVSNAIKFTNEKGTIHIKSDKIENDFINIIIQDNGVGMKPEVLRNLFKISSYSSMGTQQEKGTGLGLIICKEFAVLNKGDLIASSEVDKGSTFTLKIPINN
jgi:signal transduction histidine kinase